ncbi:FtsX-like permease family protein [Kribbella sp. VKM Ac-2527]|uniref:FtsX-like permease family protein n=1 Tax=Kribbella caucasensis TaxID=2512215 RepID=A0A4R6KP42_9ACTN|nr:FtsX-like permease family protein [Kribbella sp. VKM Ac-2527]TDO54425.1 FtsX-like permease family protein [Kribbella sp. VKM Ac-2527]
MNLRTLIELARPRSSTDRRRMALLVSAVALAGAFLLAGQRVARHSATYLDGWEQSSYLAEPGLRQGVVVAAVLMAGTACALAFQALRLGTAARDRRLTTLRLAGATPNQVRLVGAVDAGLGGLAGGILAGPLYFVLAAAVQALPGEARVLPAPNYLDLLAWPVAIVLLTVLAAIAGRSLRRGLVTEPTVDPAATGWRTKYLVIGLVGLALIVLSSMVFNLVTIFAQTAGVVLAASGFAPLAVARHGRRLGRSGDPLKMLAGARLLHTARPVGRMLALLVFCGGVAGVVMAMAVDLQATSGGVIQDDPFYLTGFAFVGLLALFAALAAGVALLAGTADDLLDQRRQLAALSVFGVGESQLLRSVRRRLTSTVAPAITIGLLIGGGLYSSILLRAEYSSSGRAFVVVLVGAVTGGLVAWLVAAAAAFLLRGQVREAVDPQNLRSA